MTIISTALPKIASEFNALDQIAWVGTSYMLTSTCFQVGDIAVVIHVPLYGKFSDIFGRKSVFLFAITVFEIGSVLSGTAQNMIMLIVFRAIQGVGGGGISK
ncbi:major facilitator superfamily domain-containing protein [Jimgerdemannia flammicorona]|uniref:Major facilitator superfamily domain-containing protein n=1 Tax=Jimgerdemannia flammicorona TaxID=994334 RepID=A0A433Q5Y8_9FUNG|nr:major facilitator superfamily domain-containing protein [Jimgerdemannia flammicorona]